MSEIIKIFAGKEVFTFNQAYKFASTSKASLSRLLNKYINQNKILKIRDGLYYIVPFGQDTVTPNPYKVAASLTSDYYLAYHTALELHGSAYTTFNSKYVAASKPFKPFSCRSVTYQSVKPLNNDIKTGIIEMTMNSLAVKVSDRERTVIDCLDRLNYSGGIEETVKSLHNFPSVNFDKLFKYLKKLNRKILFSKTGWMLQLLKEQWNVEDKFLIKLRKNLSKRPMYLVKREGEKYKFNSEWNLMVPANLNNILEGV